MSPTKVNELSFFLTFDGNVCQHRTMVIIFKGIIVYFVANSEKMADFYDLCGFPL